MPGFNLKRALITLVYRINVEYGINVEAGKFPKNNKRGGWKILTKIINVEGEKHH